MMQNHLIASKGPPQLGTYRGVAATALLGDSYEMGGGTVFTFVTDGFNSAFGQAKETSKCTGVSIAGGSSAIQQALRAGVVGNFRIHVVPVVLGNSARLFDSLGDIAFEQVQSFQGEGVVHTKYRSLRNAPEAPGTPAL